MISIWVKTHKKNNNNQIYICQHIELLLNESGLSKNFLEVWQITDYRLQITDYT